MSLQLSEKVLALAAEAQSGLTEQFARIDAIAEENTNQRSFLAFLIWLKAEISTAQPERLSRYLENTLPFCM